MNDQIKNIRVEYDQCSLLINKNQTAWLGSSLAEYKCGWMFGKTPPSAIVVLAINLLSSSSFLMASKICLGLILFFLLSLAAFPASSKTSAAKYSRTAERYTGAPAPTLSVYLPYFKYLETLPTGN